MAPGADKYSRMVAWLKILLPLLALAVLGTVFLINSDDSYDSGFTFSKADLETLESGSFLSQSKVDGVTSKGEPFQLIAALITPDSDNPNLVTISDLSGSFDFLSGGWLKLEAESAVMDIGAQTVVFEHGGQMESSDGNVATVSTMLVHLASGEISGTGAVASGPLGEISADSFRIEADEAENRVLWFENNVRMRYDLQNEGE